VTLEGSFGGRFYVAQIVFLRGAALGAVLLIGACGGGGATLQANAATPAAHPSAGAGNSAGNAGSVAARIGSQVTALTNLRQTGLGSFNGVAYTRTTGVVTGVIDPREAIVGIGSQPLDAGGDVDYSAAFEVIAPAAGAVADRVIVVEAENRGSSVAFAALDETAAVGAPASGAYPPGLGSAFLENHATSYARVQWQTGVAAGVPATAQGMGLAIVRDFGRFLGGTTAAPAGAAGFATYPTVILTGISQSSWFVNDLIAEGFNVDPVTSKRVFAGAIAIDGTGNWLALNELAAGAGAPEEPYLLPNGAPLSNTQLLQRPATDPLYVDAANYTDFYRLRASLTDVIPANARAYRYDWPSPHVQGAAGSTSPASCNGGTPLALNPIGYRPYYRAIVLGMEAQLGVTSAAGAMPLPPSAVFRDVAPAPGLTDFNALEGASVLVPAVDANAMPTGGVRFPDAVVPLGQPVPVAIAPVSTASISATCGNFGGFAPFSGAQLAQMYGSEDAYAAQYDAALKPLIAAGYLLPDDEATMVSRAQANYDTYAAGN
jgi:hypothetical protein